MVAHATLTGANLHEPKGADTASADTVYISDGAGSGAWQKITELSLDNTDIFTINRVYLTAVLNDVSTAETIFVPLPFNAILTQVISCLQGTITGADSIITVRDSNGNSAGTFTVAFTGSAAGDIDTLFPATNNVFTSGQKVQIQTDGGSTGLQKLFLTLVFTVTG